MRNAFLTALACLASLVVAGEVKLKVGGASGLTGSATLLNKVQDDGSKYVLLTMELRSTDGQIVTVQQESVYEKTGKPVRKLQTTTTAGGTTQKIVALFEAGVVRVRATDAGKSKDQVLSIPVGTNTLAKYEFWFVRDKIPAGGRTTYSRFDLMDLKWEKVEVVYRGTKPYTYDGKGVTAHYVEYNGAKAYVDDSGDPYFIDLGGITLTRVKS